MQLVGRTYSPEQAQTIRDAFLLAARTFSRKLSRAERETLAKVVVTLAAKGCNDPKKLATRAIIRML